MSTCEGSPDDTTLPIPPGGDEPPRSSDSEQDERIGREFGSYRILGRLGEGGMGEVYLAKHTKLGKTVAVKFLRRGILADERLRLRFAREARAAATLDHSSICSVYDFDDAGDQPYISMAYVEGRNLRERIAAGPLPPEEAVLVAIQVAEGLQEAHRAGILHRDIKPSNILLAGSGQAKIVDFGLALIWDTTRVTRSGTIVGTATYMSPEQATGRQVDSRTDIWSLGVVLYEMVCGNPPFIAERPDAVLHMVTHQDPLPLEDVCAEAPPELCWVVRRCLAKDPADRYADCAELLHDLRSLRQKLVRRRGRPAPPSWILKNRSRLLIGGLAGLALAAAIVLAVVFPPWRDDTDVFRRAVPLQVTSDEAWEGDPAISPDGTRIAYSKCISGNHDIYVINARGGTPRRLTDDPAADRDPCWTPDGGAILFASGRLGETSVWRVDPQGGPPSLLMEEAMDPAVSPDGEWLAFGRIAEGGKVRIALASLAGAAEVQMLTGDGDGPEHHRHPAWSPDGATICYATQHNLWVVAVQGGAARPLVAGGLADDQPCWSAGEDRIYFSSMRGNLRALWRVNSRGGRPERLTFGTSGDGHPSVSRDGDRLAYATDSGENNEDVVILDRRTGQEHRLRGEAHDCFYPTISADGRTLVYLSNREGGRNELWVQDLDDGQPRGDPRRLTDQPGNAALPALSADGQWVAYYRIIGAQRDLWVVPTRGGAPQQITDDPECDEHAAWSPDGRMLAFASERGNGHSSIWTVPVIDGRAAGEPRRITPAGLPALFPDWSPDGGRIAFLGHEGGHNFAYVVRSDGSEPPRRISAVVDPHRSRWNRSTGDLWIAAHWEDGPLSIRAVTPDLADSRPLTPPLVLEPALEYGLFDIDGSGRLVVYSYPERTGDIWLLELEDGAF